MKILFCSSFPISLNNDIKGGGNWISGIINSLRAYQQNVEICIAYIDFKIKKIELIKTLKINNLDQNQ